MELYAARLQGRDATLHRLLPFGVVLSFLLGGVVLGFASPVAGAVTLIATMAGVVTTYLTGRATFAQRARAADQGTSPPEGN